MTALARPYRRLLSDLEEAGHASASAQGLKDALDESTGIGGGEAGTAGAHQDRELVELLQNGRDAIQRSDNVDTGTLYVEVHNTGVLVANTGAPFDIQDSEIREDIRKVTFSRKNEDAIGEKGVGLTSVCMVGDAYEVWTQPDDDESNIDRFQCGPVNATAAVTAQTEAATTGTVQDALDDFTERLAPDLTQVRDWFETATSSIPVDDVRSADIEALPFFIIR